jgi:hypothetical protein
MDVTSNLLCLVAFDKLDKADEVRSASLIDA